MYSHHYGVSLLRVLGQAVALLCLNCPIGVASMPPLKVLVPPAETTAPVVQTGWVTDAAEIIPDDIEQRLAAKLAEFEGRTRHQMVVVTLPTLDGRDVADVADELGNAWHVGQAGHDDGIVLLVAPNDRRVRISTAEGMRQELPDATWRQIIDEAMIPRFRADDLPGGIEAGMDAIIAHVG